MARGALVRAGRGSATSRQNAGGGNNWGKSPEPIKLASES
jgi:hypothetical protein